MEGFFFEIFNYALERCDLQVASNMSIPQLWIVNFSWLNMSPEWLVQQAKK